MSKIQKGGKNAKQAPVEAVVASEEGQDLFMTKLTKEKRNLVKKLEKIKATESKEGELNADQKASLARKGEFSEQVKQLEYYIDLYAKSNPNWDKPAEVKVVEPEFTAESVQASIDAAVKNAVFVYAAMQTLHSVSEHFDLDDDEENMVHGAKELAVQTVLSAGMHDDAVNCGVSMAGHEAVVAMCNYCFSAEGIAKANSRIAAANAPAKVEPVAEPVHVAAVEEKVEEVAEEPVQEVAATEEPATENAPEAKEEAAQEETKVEAKPERQPKKEWADNRERKQRYDNNREGGADNRGGRDNRGRDNRGARGGRGGRGGARGPKADDDGFVVHDSNARRGGFKPRGGERREGGERGGRGRYNNNYNRDGEGNVQRGGGRGGRGRGEGEGERPQTAQRDQAPVQENKEKEAAQQE